MHSIDASVCVIVVTCKDSGVEAWMLELERGMRSAMKAILYDATLAYAGADR